MGCGRAGGAALLLLVIGWWWLLVISSLEEELEGNIPNVELLEKNKQNPKPRNFCANHWLDCIYLHKTLTKSAPLTGIKLCISQIHNLGEDQGWDYESRSKPTISVRTVHI
jgi:hypothetical protein